MLQAEILTLGPKSFVKSNLCGTGGFKWLLGIKTAQECSSSCSAVPSGVGRWGWAQPCPCLLQPPEQEPLPGGCPGNHGSVRGTQSRGGDALGMEREQLS